MEWSQPIAEQTWRTKYRHGDETNRLASFARVVAGVYAKDPDLEAGARALTAMRELRWCPAGRIQAGAGTGNRITLMNCYVSPTIQDSMETIAVTTGELPVNQAGILDALKVAAITQQMGGGIGMDFSTLRPAGSLVRRTGTTASGPLPFMDMWDAMCKTVMSAGHRRGAMMATMRCDHPDIEDFIKAKQTKGRLTNFNVSVLVTDYFMKAVKINTGWALQFNGEIVREIMARELWDLILCNTYEHAEPGVIFIDRVNALNNLRYCETIAATNPCGEQPLPPNGACNLGAVNLAVHVGDPFTEKSYVRWNDLADTVQVGVRFLDNVLDVTQHPTAEQAEEARLKRRIGLGVTGLANLLQQLRLRYGSPGAVKKTEQVMQFIANKAYATSAKLADERGRFPLFKHDIATDLIRRLSADVISLIENHGLRNGVILTVAPTGTTSLYYDNVSSGIEPVFAHSYTRNVRQFDDTYQSQTVYDWGYLAYKKFTGGMTELGGPALPDYMVTTDQLTVEEHLQMQAACQRWVDASISKTVNCPATMTFDEFRHVYERAYELGLKGCTTYRPNPASGRGAILEVANGGTDQTTLNEALETLRGGDDTSTPSTTAGTSDVAPGAPAPGPAPGVTKKPRPDLLRGYTKKIRWPSLDHAHYVTVNFDAADQPFEVFITSKDAQHQEWMQALSLLLTSILRKGGDVTYWAEELAQVHSAAGGHILEKRFVPSLVAFIARTVHELMFLNPAPHTDAITRGLAESLQHTLPIVAARVMSESFNCPQCRAGTLVHAEGCDRCDNCGYNRCG